MSEISDLPPFEPGDPIPPMRLPAKDGKSFDLLGQPHAGRPFVLLCGPLDEIQAELERHPKEVAAIQAEDAHVYGLAGTPERIALPDAAPANGFVMDPDHQVARRLLGAERGIAVLDATGRLLARLSPGAFVEALALCRDAQARDEARIVDRQAPVLLVDSVLEPALIGQILEFWERSEKLENAVSAGHAGDTYARDVVKRRSDVHIHNEALKAALLDRLKRRLLPEIYKTFRSKIASYEDFRVGCYSEDNQGEFRRHRDNITRNTAHRRFALSINLNAGFEGGEVRFPEYGRTLYRPRPGGGVVFSCALLHEVLPVTKGRRFVLLSFLNDAEGLQAERALAAKAPK